MTPTSDEEMQNLWAKFHSPPEIKYSVFHSTDFHETHSCSMKLCEDLLHVISHKTTNIEFLVRIFCVP